MTERTLLPINLTYLKHLSSGNTAFEREMLELFISEVSKDVQEMSAAYSISEFKTIANIGHKLKSSVQLVGFESLVDILSTIETFKNKTTLTADEQALFEYLINQLKNSFIEIETVLHQ